MHIWGQPTQVVSSVRQTNFFLSSCMKDSPSGTLKLGNNSCARCHYSSNNCIGPQANECKNDCLDTRYFSSSLMDEKSIEIPVGVCECKEGYFESNKSDCTSKPISIF